MKDLGMPEKKVITTKELAAQLKTDKKVIIENAKKFLPNKIFEQGKVTYWSEAEITVLIDGMKNNNSNQYREKGTVTGAVTDISTELTPALKIKKAMLLMQEGYEEELAILRAKNLEKDKLIEEQKPAVEYHARLIDRGHLTNIRDTAKELQIPERKFVIGLIENKWIYRDKGNKIRACADKIKDGLLEEKDWEQNGKSGVQTFITVKGKQKLLKWR